MKYWLLIILGISLNTYGDNDGVNHAVNAHIFRFSQSLETLTLENGLGMTDPMVEQDHKWLLRFSYDHVNDGVVGIENDKRVAEFNDNIQSYSFGVSYLLQKRWLVGLLLPLHSVKPGQNLLDIKNINSQREVILGDARIQTKVRLSALGKKWNYALVGELAFPTQRDKARDYLVTDDSFGSLLQFAVDYTLNQKLKFIGNLGFSYNGNAEFLTLDARARILVGLGMIYHVTPRLNLNAEWSGYASLDFDTDQNPLTLLIGGNYQISPRGPRFYAALALDRLILPERSHDFYFAAGLKWSFARRQKKSLPQKALPEKSYSIYFPNRTYIVSPEIEKQIEESAAFAQQNQSRIKKIIIEGHSSTPGSQQHNHFLAKKRAYNTMHTLYRKLASHGFRQDQFYFKSDGELRPLVLPDIGTGDVEKDQKLQSQNRRVIIRFVGDF